MKKSVSLSIIILFIIGLLLCSKLVNIRTTALSELGTWYLETMADENGNIIAGNYKNGNLSGLKSNMTCQFNNDGTFAITKDTAAVWSGSYTKEKAANGIMLLLKLTDGTSVQAGLGEKKNYNGEKVNSIVMKIDNKYITFVDENIH